MLDKQMSDVAHSEGLRKVRHPKRGPESPRMRAERRLKEAPLTLRSIDRHSVMRPRKSQREATACHEAGHAVIAHAFGYKLELASITPEPDRHGAVRLPSLWYGIPIHIDMDCSSHARKRIERVIQIFLAGPIAQRSHCSYAFRRSHRSSDIELVRDLAASVSGSREQTRALIQRLMIKTSEMVEGQWVYIARVAGLLLKRDRLNSAEFLLAMRPAQNRAPGPSHRGRCYNFGYSPISQGGGNRL